MAVVATVLVGRAWHEWRVGAVLHGVDGVVYCVVLMKLGCAVS